MTHEGMALGLDLGGSKISAVVLDARGQEHWRQRVATPAGDYAATLAALVKLVTAAEAALGMTLAVGLGHPGAERPDGRIKNANSTCLIGQCLRADLEQRLARRVALANDADCFALSESRDGTAAGARSVFGVILGTGVGGGIVIDGRLLAGPNRIAGEWGHNPLAPDPADMPGAAPPCYCGRSGCVEAWLSGPALAADHARQTGECLSAEAVAARAAAGDAAAHSTLERHALRLAQALAGVINVLDPEVIVLGGGLSRLPGLAGRVSAAWGAFVFTDEPVSTRLLLPRFGDDSGVRGAAWLALGQRV
ncbi:ROK family protein [Laribacter hongkongensis HLHK9]|uniref:ROK family protein n=1 Tax=Laribacter hongkongensis (strain HLHK9) TaxID=557598 RepID=C1D9Z6_LARHH|nr:ROK family protein [Laribacter hongkongensis]ACO73109.1 ROK family protein [Laribacter hongkongensis HLHK9]